MPSPCPICNDRKFRKVFDELIAAGGELIAAKKLCDNELILPDDAVCSTYRVKVHAVKHSGVDPDRIHPSFIKIQRPDPVKVASDRREKEITRAVIESYVEEVASIDQDRILASIGIHGRPQTMSGVLTLAQEIGVSLVMATGAIAMDRLEKHKADPEGRRYPNVELKGAELALNMMSAAFGYSQAVSLQSAVDTVEKAGFEVTERGANNKHELPSAG
jgi:hypothetical protein